MTFVGVCPVTARRYARSYAPHPIRHRGQLYNAEEPMTLLELRLRSGTNLGAIADITRGALYPPLSGRS